MSGVVQTAPLTRRIVEFTGFVPVRGAVLTEEDMRRAFGLIRVKTSA